MASSNSSSSSTRHSSSITSSSTGSVSNASPTSSFSEPQTFTQPFPSFSPSPSGGPILGGGNGGQDNNNGQNAGIQPSAQLYLYTFLATLILLLGVSSAIVMRSLILRRRHRRMVEEAIANGTWVPPTPRVKVDLRKKPRLWDAHIAPPVLDARADEWEGIMVCIFIPFHSIFRLLFSRCVSPGGVEARFSVPFFPFDFLLPCVSNTSPRPYLCFGTEDEEVPLPHGAYGLGFFTSVSFTSLSASLSTLLRGESMFRGRKIEWLPPASRLLLVSLLSPFSRFPSRHASTNTFPSPLQHRTSRPPSPPQPQPTTPRPPPAPSLH
ncbi:hypothetical protein B0H11DRAFT_187814 [Mycena galericulata]|nr:hypothetical protein B0H11DRAFT_187814 [Mycena galericulata]